MSQTTQTTKPAAKPAAKAKAPAKPAAKVAAPAETKAPAKSETKAAGKQPFFSTLYGLAIGGALGKAAQAFYKRADDYHAKAGTSFPRKRTDGTRETLTGEDIRAVIKQAAAGNLPSGSAVGQAVYDLMRTKADHKDGAAILADMRKAGVPV